MSIVKEIKPLIAAVLKDHYGFSTGETDLTINTTKPEFEGDYTLVLFSYVKQLKKSPEQLGNEIGDALIKAHPQLFVAYNVIKGFLNLTISDDYWRQFLKTNYNNQQFGFGQSKNQKVMVEYSSPNTNKPLHLGHLRNIFLGWSIAEILNRSGYETVKSCVVNDRGIHICKSMIAWQLFANGATPESTATKGDHFVGEYYVKFNDAYKQQVDELVAKGMEKAIAEKEAPIMKATQQMLLDWEKGDKDVLALWNKMNGWVYDGFGITYKRIGADFQKMYYESNTYLLGKQFVEAGLKEGVFFKKEDGSVWIDLTADGLDEKLVLRKDGTSVYITQDLGLADQKYDEFKYDQSIYVIADEQNYHMKVLKLILQKLNKPYAEGIFHLSYGMVELPNGRMKSREGTVVDADDMITEMVNVARTKTEELGKVKDFTTDELKELYDTLALGALKFFLLRVDPKKRMIFNPEESIDFHGFTGPFIQYTHARIKSVLRKAGDVSVNANIIETSEPILKLEKELIVLLEQYPVMLDQAIAEHNPSVIAIYVFNLAKSFNTFYTEHSVLNAETETKKQFRLQLSSLTAHVIASGMSLLGIKVPERM
ncbi:MAG TPA: arginine--tRNA ligase [Chitinophagaceae bacterium]|jgi:arginyl-tRNA synthetase|nr:arginine--tRNA ligase [Chitinophagaceae bacterium]HNF47100.1 arginine--tRNA ligase [Chitinophagaceae bacterium]HNK61768.1 arginine--tRNA ligase [Chitinophagaceae bacterium]HRF24571.1 arginine--tRNA ligase [Chitinophagaceae bacterium]